MFQFSLVKFGNHHSRIEVYFMRKCRLHPYRKSRTTPPLQKKKNECPRYDTKLHLAVRLFFLRSIGFTLLYFRMAIMPLVPKTKMAEVGKLISLGNLLSRKTTWLVLATTSTTSILSHVFGAYSMTKIVYKYSRLPTLILFHIFT